MKLGSAVKVAQGDWYIIPRYQHWLLHGRDLRKERDALGKIMTRPARVRTGTFSASGAGQCLRRRQLAYLGYSQAPIDDRAANIFANGDYVHLRHQVAGMIEGYLVGAEVSVARPELRLTGTMDGKADDGGLVEYKSIHTRGFTEVNTYGVKSEHREQVHSYMLAAGIDVAHVVYEDKNTNALREFTVHRNEQTVAKITRDLEELNEATEAQTLLPMLSNCVAEKGEFRTCPFRLVCPLARFGSPTRSIRVPSKQPTA